MVMSFGASLYSGDQGRNHDIYTHLTQSWAGLSCQSLHGNQRIGVLFSVSRPQLDWSGVSFQSRRRCVNWPLASYDPAGVWSSCHTERQLSVLEALLTFPWNWIITGCHERSIQTSPHSLASTRLFLSAQHKITGCQSERTRYNFVPLSEDECNFGANRLGATECWFYCRYEMRRRGYCSEASVCLMPTEKAANI